MSDDGSGYQHGSFRSNMLLLIGCIGVIAMLSRFADPSLDAHRMEIKVKEEAPQTILSVHPIKGTDRALAEIEDEHHRIKVVQVSAKVRPGDTIRCLRVNYHLTHSAEHGEFVLGEKK